MSTRKRKTSSEPQTEKTSICARTDEQKEYIKAIVQNDIVICCGKSGSGKTCVAAGIAVDWLKRGLVDRVIISRPCVGTEDLGYLPGEFEEKIQPYLQPLFTELEQFINIKACIANGKIKVLPVSYMRGVTFKNSFVIVDEVQNLTESQLRMLLTRLGENSKLVLTGDTTQSDLEPKQQRDFQKVINKMLPIATPENKIAVVRLNTSVRHPLVELIESVLCPVY
jgi:phosphate starvation-inducible PhoH-like protein